ncbi:MAG: hypothetical protein Q9209_005693 [Squamulea sp. 1 TL-2023]
MITGPRNNVAVVQLSCIERQTKVAGLKETKRDYLGALTIMKPPKFYVEANSPIDILSLELSLGHHRLDPRALYITNSGNMRYFLETFEAANPDSLGLASSSIRAFYYHALTLLAQSRASDSLSSTFGFSFGHLDLTLVTTDGAPIPWDTALEFARKMHGTAVRGLNGVQYQAFVFDLALDITIKVTLRLLFDRPLGPVRPG